MTRWRYLFVAVGAFALTFVGTVAYASTNYAAQDGRDDERGLYEATINIDVRASYEVSGQCNMHGFVLTDVTRSLQVQAGQVNCYNNNLDGTCYDGHFFVESVDSGAYHCKPGGTFSTWTDYATFVDKFANSTNLVAGAADGTEISLGGYVSGDVLRNPAWLESDGPVSGCPQSGNNLNFNAWQYYGADLRWHTPTPTDAPISHTGDYICFTPGTLSSSGAFNVSN